MNFWQNKERKSVISVKRQPYNFSLYRLNEQEYYDFSENSLPIADDPFFIWNLHRSAETPEDELNLAKIYLVLTEIAGESSRFYDDWKGSFCFPFALKIVKKERTLDNYLLIISDWRGNIEFRFQRLIGENESYPGIQRHVIREPFEDEFSRKEINILIAYLYGYFVGYFSSLEEYRPPAEFFKHIDSNIILYGYSEGTSWEENYEDSDAYEKKLEELKLKYPND